MTQITKISTTYTENNNKDFKESYRELDTAKRFSDIDAEAQENGAEMVVMQGENIVDLENITLAEYRKIAGKYIHTLEKEITEVRSDSATVYKNHIKYILHLCK